MVQILPKRPSVAQQLLSGAAQGLPNALQMLISSRQQSREETELEKLGIPKGVTDPNVRKYLLERQERQKLLSEDASGERGQGEPKSNLLERYKNFTPEKRAQFDSLFPKEAASLRQQIKEQKPVGGVTAQAVPEQVANSLEKTLSENPDASANELATKFDKAGIPRIYSNSYIETRRREQEAKERKETSIESEIRKEVAPVKAEIAKKAQAARKGIENKRQLMSIIDRGNLNDPSFAVVAENLPFDLGKRMLSNDTVEYKAGLVEEFTDLRNIFQGQTRIKEIDLLENKLADTYLTDEQKKAVLKSRIRALESDIVREEAAEEVEREKPGLGILQFQREVEKRAKPKLEKIFDSILDEQKFIIEQAEKRKARPLDSKNPEDQEILRQLYREAGNNKEEALKLAQKYGYTFK